MTPLVSWDDYRTVLAVSVARSLAGAAEQLGVNQSTVFRRLGAMEERLGARLFERSRTGYSLTAAGEGMVRLAEKMAEEITDFERQLTGQDLRPQGDLRVTTNDTLVVHLLTPIFASFRRKFPEITLDVVIGNQSLNCRSAMPTSPSGPRTTRRKRWSAGDWRRFHGRSTAPKASASPVSTRSTTGRIPG